MRQKISYQEKWHVFQPFLQVSILRGLENEGKKIQAIQYIEAETKWRVFNENKYVDDLIEHMHFLLSKTCCLFYQNS